VPRTRAEVSVNSLPSPLMSPGLRRVVDGPCGSGETARVSTPTRKHAKETSR
jgi:hypothetical protein